MNHCPIPFISSMIDIFFGHGGLSRLLTLPSCSVLLLCRCLACHLPVCPLLISERVNEVSVCFPCSWFCLFSFALLSWHNKWSLWNSVCVCVCVCVRACVHACVRACVHVIPIILNNDYSLILLLKRMLFKHVAAWINQRVLSMLWYLLCIHWYWTYYICKV